MSYPRDPWTGNAEVFNSEAQPTFTPKIRETPRVRRVIACVVGPGKQLGGGAGQDRRVDHPGGIIHGGVHRVRVWEVSDRYGHECISMCHSFAGE